MCWRSALTYLGPTAIILSRQKLSALDETKAIPYDQGVAKGAYIVKKEKTEKPDFTLLATGSELKLAFEVAFSLERLDKSVRIISFPCFELFDIQPQDYKDQVLGGDLGKRVSIEAGSEMGWAKYIGSAGIAIAVDDFGYSAPADYIADELGFTVDGILQRLI